MTITAAQYTAWLNDPSAIRCLLFEVGVNTAGVETTRYFSTVGFNTGAADTPANTAYPAIARGQGLAITESIQLDGQGALTIGDIQITNVEGERDSWLSDIWTNRSANVYLGDIRWPRADFKLVFAGVVADIGSQDRDTLNLILSNKLQRLNTAITDVKWGGEVQFQQAGLVVTVYKPNHNRHVGSPVVVTPSASGPTIIAGTYAITGAPDADHFTYTAPSSQNATGKLVLAGVNADAIIPLCFGEVHNITPLLIDGTVLRYQCHGGSTQWIFEVRDNGKPVAVTTNQANGYFELLASPAGAITASVQGDNGGSDGYTNTVSGLVQRIVTGYGVLANRFTSADLDATSLGAFDVAHPQPVGIYVSDRANVLAAMQEIAGSIGAQPVVTRTGLLRLVQLNFPPLGAPTPIPQSSQIDRTLQVVGRSTVQAAVKLNYVKNWTVQAGLQTAIPAEHKEMFASEWWSVTAQDVNVAAQYKLTAEPVAQNTYLLTKEDALAEANRRLAIVKQPRTTYRFEGTAAHLELELGQAVTLYSNRFGLSAGVLGVVTSLSPDWSTCHVTVEVTV